MFRQRLSHGSLKAYAPMPICILGSKSLSMLDWDSRQFSNKERERKNTCLCCFHLPRWHTLRFTQATVKTTITQNNFRRCRVSLSPFVRQPFSKQLYLKCGESWWPRYRRGHEFKSRSGLNFFSGFNFTTALVVFTATVNHIFITVDFLSKIVASSYQQL